MTSAFARLSAIVSALLALAGVGLWLAAGAPDVTSLPEAWQTTASTLALDIHASVPLLTHSTLFILAASVAGAALLALITLLRGSSLGYVRYLGTGLGWWSLGYFFLLMAPAVPSITALRLPLSLLVAGDVLGFLLMLGAALALLRFWTSYPREITLEELRAFVLAKENKKYQAAAWRGRLYRLLLRDRATAVLESRIDQFGRMNRRLLRYTLWPGRGAQAGLLAVAAAGGLLWRLVETLPGDTADALFGPFIVFGLLLFLPGFHCMNILHMHRAHGTEDERRQIEWIWTSFWIAIVLVVLAEALGALALVDITVVHAFGLDPTQADFVLSLVLLTLVLLPLCAPFCVLVALSLSIFYRGTVDPRLALRGVTVWTLLGVILTLIFVFVERAIAVKAVAWFGLPPQTGLVTAGAVVAATFQPIRKRSERYVNRFVERVLPTSVLASGRRRTAAVAITDISGYTALSAQDEQSALLASALLQKEARRLADRHGGRVVKSTGDGVILCFMGAEPALTMVQELHAAALTGASALNLTGLKLHSGLNWGEITEMHDGDIYGQTVNLTARIADWARAGEIGASETFCVQLPARPAGFEPMGPQSFKNVPQPVSCFKLAEV